MSISEATAAPAAATDRVPLSHTQNFLRMFDQGNDAGPFGPRYNMVVGWRIRGRIDVPTLRLAMGDVVARHDCLRSVIVRGDDGTGHQTIQPPSPARLDVRDLPPAAPETRDARVEELLTEVEAGSYDSGELPHLRGVLGRFDDSDAVLALIVHHTSSDGWSMQLLMRDIAHCYAVRRGFDVPPLPPARPYHEYAARQQRADDAPETRFARDHWREKLRGARVLGVPTDHPRSAGLPKASPVHRFSISADVVSGALELARGMRSSPFMVLMAAYNVLLHKMTGATDLVIPTLAAGRSEPEYQDTVGPFFNFVPLRTVISETETFREVAEKTRTTCIEAFSYDLPFTQILQEAPELMAAVADDRLAACAFQVWQFSTVLDRAVIGDLEYSDVRNRVLSQYDGTDIPDGALLTLDLDPSGRIFGNLAYNKNLYDEATMVRLVTDYERILRTAVTAPDVPVQDL